MNDHEKGKTIEHFLRELAHEIAEDRYMLMEYLGPIVDGCRAALSVRVDKVTKLKKLTEKDFQHFMNLAGNSFENISICLKVSDADELYSLVFSEGAVQIVNECIDPQVVIIGNYDSLREILDIDSKMSPLDLLGDKIRVEAKDARDALVGLGFLSFPTLLRMARSGIDPSSLLAADADALIMATASDLVTKLVKKWLDLHLQVHS